MRFYKNYILLILLLALVFNWVVEGSSYMDKGDMNLGLLPKFSIIIIEVLQVLILLRLMLLYTDNNFIISAIALVGLFCLFEFGILKAMGANKAIFLSGIRYYFSSFPLFLLSYLLASKGVSLKREFHWLLFLVFLQIPVVIYQYMHAPMVQLENQQQPLYDMISGTMGGIASNIMSLIIGIGLIYSLIQLIKTKQVIYFFAALILLVPPILAEAKGMLIVITLTLIALAFIYKFNSSKILLYGAIAAVMLVGFTYAYSLLGYGKPLNLTYLIEYASSESGRGRLSRIDSILHGFDVLSDNAATLFGTGIGNANKSPLDSNGKFYDFFMIRHSLDILITETGIVGLFLFIFLLGKLARVTWCLIRDDELLKDKSDLLMMRVLFGTIFIFAFGLIWVDVLFRVQFMYPFGMMAGYAVGLYHKHKSEGKQLMAQPKKLLRQMA